MPIKIDSTNGSITLTAEDGSGNAGLTIPRAGYLSADGNGANLTNVLTLSGGAMTGAITTNSTFDGVDIATRDAILTSTTTTANAALPKAGGALTGALTTNSTFDGVDIATRDGVLSTTVTTANAALPKSGGAMTGAITTNSTFDGRDVGTDGTKLDTITIGTTVGYPNIPKSGASKTASYTLATTDIGELIEIGSSGAVVIPDATFSTGDVVLIFNNTTGNITLTCSITTAYLGGEDADKSTITLATRGVCSVLFISGTICVVTGNAE